MVLTGETPGKTSLSEIPTDIVLYTTSCAGNAKVLSDTRRMKYLLKAKRIEFREIDLSENPLDRIRMLEQSDCNVVVPQLHVNGKFIGTADDIQEQEDFGELDDLLRGADPSEVVARTKAAIAARVLLEQVSTVQRKKAVFPQRNLEQGEEEGEEEVR
jgi:glutaredoxin